MNDKVVLIGDKATAHSQKPLPEGMTWIGLPTACPEINRNSELSRRKSI
jgi:hypothetical protein